MDGLESLSASEDRVNRKKQLQRMKPAEDERKLQAKLFVKYEILLNDSGNKSNT